MPMTNDVNKLWPIRAIRMAHVHLHTCARCCLLNSRFFFLFSALPLCMCFVVNSWSWRNGHAFGRNVDGYFSSHTDHKQISNRSCWILFFFDSFLLLPRQSLAFGHMWNGRVYSTECVFEFRKEMRRMKWNRNRSRLINTHTSDTNQEIAIAYSFFPLFCSRKNIFFLHLFRDYLNTHLNYNNYSIKFYRRVRLLFDAWHNARSIRTRRQRQAHIERVLFIPCPWLAEHNHNARNWSTCCN